MRGGRAWLAAAAVAVVLGATGVAVTALSGGDDKKDRTQDAQEAGGTADPDSGTSPGAMDPVDESRSAEKGDRKREPTGEAQRPDKDGMDGTDGTDGKGGADGQRDEDGRDGQGTKGGGSSGDGDSADEETSDKPASRPEDPADASKGGSGSGDGAREPACHSAGGGRYNCSVWRTAKSYTSSGAEAGVLNAGTNYFYCQRDLGRRETHGQWTNVWWAKTDDDSGNTGVFVSDVYLQGGDNDKPVPGLPLC